MTIQANSSSMASALISGLTAGAASLLQLIDSLSLNHANYVRGDYVEGSLIPVMKSIAAHVMKTEESITANSSRDNMVVILVAICVAMLLILVSLLFIALKRMGQENEKISQACSILADKMGIVRNQDFPVLRL